MVNSQYYTLRYLKYKIDIVVDLHNPKMLLNLINRLTNKFQISEISL